MKKINHIETKKFVIYTKKNLVLIIEIKFLSENTINLQIIVVTPKKYRGGAHNISSLRYKTPKEISAVFHKGSKYDYHFNAK